MASFKRDSVTVTHSQQSNHLPFFSLLNKDILIVPFFFFNRAKYIEEEEKEKYAVNSEIIEMSHSVRQMAQYTHLLYLIFSCFNEIMEELADSFSYRILTIKDGTSSTR